MSTRFRSSYLIPINDWSEVPEFASEAEEAEFWGTHGLGPALLDQMGPLDDVLPPPRPRRRRVVMYPREFSREIRIQPRRSDRATHPEIRARTWLIAS
jgi:hypothetical protein